MVKDRTTGAYVLHVRTLLNASQEELAKTMGVSERTVRRWENNEAPTPYHATLHMHALVQLKQLLNANKMAAAGIKSLLPPATG